MLKWLVIWNIVLTALLVVGFTIGGMVLFNHADILDGHTEALDNHWEKMIGAAVFIDKIFLELGTELEEAFNKAQAAVDENQELIRENRDKINAIIEYLE